MKSFFLRKKSAIILSSASLTRRAVASAVIVSIGTLGGVISGQIYQANQKPRYFLGIQ